MTLRVSRLLSSVLVATAAFAATNTLGGPAAAETFPSKPIRIISPFSAGSPPDAFGRLVAQQMSTKLGQSVVVENRPGAGTTIGTKAGATADPDGYTLVQVNAALSYAPVLYPNPGYDPVKSFTPVALLATWTHVLVAHPSVAANNLQELVAYAKANPGKLNIGSPLGNPPHVLAEMLRTEIGADINDVTYRQAPQMIADLIGGRLQLHFAAGEPIGSMIREGKMKAYASTGAARDPNWPNIPTMAEAGLPQLTMNPSDWTGFLAPVGTPPDLVAKLGAATDDAMGSPDVQAMLKKLGWQGRKTTPQEFMAFVAADAGKWPRVVKAAGLKVE